MLAGQARRMISRPVESRREAILTCLFATFTALACAGLLTAAALVPAPPVVLPFLVTVCIATPMGAALELPAAIACLRAAHRGSLDDRALDVLRRQLDHLPETRHPLDL
jgi:hypothetical protein